MTLKADFSDTEAPRKTAQGTPTEPTLSSAVTDPNKGEQVSRGGGGGQQGGLGPGECYQELSARKLIKPRNNTKLQIQNQKIALGPSVTIKETEVSNNSLPKGPWLGGLYGWLY